MKPFLAMIMPVGEGGPVDPGYSPPWARPQPPGGGGQPPLGIWGPGFPYPDQGLPGNQPYPDQGLPGGQPYPDQGLPRPPGRPSHPIHYPPYPDHSLPPFPSQPIYLPPPPGSGAPPIAAQLPVFPPEATHPIVLPPDEALPPTAPDGAPIEWKVVWTPVTGWVVVGLPTGPTPTPSTKK